MRFYKYKGIDFCKFRSGMIEIHFTDRIATCNSIRQAKIAINKTIKESQK